MGCGRNVSGDMLSMALFCMAINDVLIKFCEGQSHANLWIRVRGAINFLSYYPERSPEQRKKDTLDLPKYGFRDSISRLTYEQLVATQRFLKEHEERLLQTKKKLPMILDLQLSPEKRREAALYCIVLFSGLHGHYNYCVYRPPTFVVPPGIRELSKGNKKRQKRVVRPKTVNKSG